MKRASVLVLFVVFALAMAAAQETTASNAMPVVSETSAVISMAPTNRPSEISLYQERLQVRNVVQQLNDAALRNEAGFFDRGIAPDYVVANAELDLAEDYDVEAAARGTAVNQHGAARRIDFHAARRDAGDFVGTELPKQRQVGEEVPDVDGLARHGQIVRQPLRRAYGCTVSSSCALAAAGCACPLEAVVVCNP